MSDVDENDKTDVGEMLRRIEGRLEKLEAGRSNSGAERSLRERSVDDHRPFLRRLYGDAPESGTSQSQPSVAQHETRSLNDHLGPTFQEEDGAAENDIQGEYAAIRDSVQRVKLPPDLRLHDGAKQGIKRADQPLANVLIKGARYLETALKILASEPRMRDDTLDNVSKVTLAHLKYIQDEYATLLVQGTFDPVTTRLFKTLQRNNSPFSSGQVTLLQSAAAISSAYRPNANGSGREFGQYRRMDSYGGFRGAPRGGRGRGTRGRGYGYGYAESGDPFNRFTSRGIPNSRPDRHNDDSPMQA